jgi:hypothetical protein
VWKTTLRHDAIVPTHIFFHIDIFYFPLHYFLWNLPSLTVCNTTYFTRSVQLILSMFLQHNVLKISRYFRMTVLK